jgi:hypothetical protein
MPSVARTQQRPWYSKFRVRVRRQAAPLVGGEEVAIELAVGAVCGADDVSQEDLLFFGVARPAQSPSSRVLQGGEVESVWVPVQRRREAMALVLRRAWSKASSASSQARPVGPRNGRVSPSRRPASQNTATGIAHTAT